MSQPKSPRPHGPREAPLSGFEDSVHELLHRELLRPPTHPGLLGTLDDYEVLEMLGAGGMGIVLLVRDRRNNKLQALKLLRPELAGHDRARTRFLSEARHMRQFAHPRIVSVSRIDLCRAVPFFVMPHFPEGSLATRLRRGPPLTKEAILQISLDLAEALTHAHERGIIHRDLKPANVLLTEEGRACLTDFGLARNLLNDDIEWIDREHREGTIPYMSPAVAAGKAEDTRCDIYAFGAVLYEMLTGRPPYLGQAEEMLAAILAGPPTPIRKVNPDPPPDLAAVAEWCLARELRSRYAEMRDVLADLRRVQSGRTLRGPRGGWRTAARGWLRRRRRIVLAGLLVLVGTAAGLVFWRLNQPRLRLQQAISAPGVANWRKAQVGHIVGEPFPVLYHTDQSRLLCFDVEGDLLVGTRPWDLSRRAMVNVEFTTVEALVDLPENADQALVVNWTRDGAGSLSVFSPQPHELFRFNGADLLGSQATNLTGDFDVGYRGLLPASSSQEPMLLTAFATRGRTLEGRTIAVRGLGAFAWPSGEVRWTLRTAPYVRDVVPVDGPGMDSPLLVIGSHASSNGVALADGTDDAHSYLYAVSAAGNLLWRRQVGDLYTIANPMVADLDGDQGPEILTWITCAWEDRKNAGFPEVGPLLVLDLHGRVLHQVDLGATLLSVHLVDSQEHEGKEILATDRLGRLHRLRPDLSQAETLPLEPVQHTTSLLRLAAVGDLNRDGSPELLFTTGQWEFVAGYNAGNRENPLPLRRIHDIELVVRDRSFSELARVQIAAETRQDELPRLELIQADEDRYPEILWLGFQYCRIYDYVPGSLHLSHAGE